MDKLTQKLAELTEKKVRDDILAYEKLKIELEEKALKKSMDDRIKLVELPEKIRMATVIYNWVLQFLKSAEYEKCVKLGRDNLVLFYSKGGTVKESYNVYGYNSKLILLSDRTLDFSTSYKWMGTSVHFVCKSSDDIVKNFIYEYVRDLYNHVTTDNVYTTIMEQLN